MSETATRFFSARKANGNPVTVWVVDSFSQLPTSGVIEGDVGLVIDTCLFYERLVNTSGWTLVFDAGQFEGTIEADDVVGLQAAVEGFLADELAGKANVSHTHAESDITNLVSDLAGKAASVHTHTLSDITDEGALAALNTVGTSQIDNDAVTFAKMQDIATDKLIGRVSASTGSPEEVTCTDFAQSLLDDAAASDARTTLGVAQVSIPVTFGNGLGSGFAPTDNTNHYMSFCANPTNTVATAANAANAVNQEKAGTITDVYFAILVGGTNGSGETGSLMIRVNNTTDTTVVNNTMVWSTGAVFTEYNTSGLSIALAAGDFWQVKIDPPTWATNPTAVFYFCQVTVTYP